jgi:hypothetical protein
MYPLLPNPTTDAQCEFKFTGTEESDSIRSSHFSDSTAVVFGFLLHGRVGATQSTHPNLWFGIEFGIF